MVQVGEFTDLKGLQGNRLGGGETHTHTMATSQTCLDSSHTCVKQTRKNNVQSIIGRVQKCTWISVFVSAVPSSNAKDKVLVK